MNDAARRRYLIAMTLIGVLAACGAVYLFTRGSTPRPAPADAAANTRADELKREAAKIPEPARPAPVVLPEPPTRAPVQVK